MSTRQVVVSGKELLKLLNKLGFDEVRVTGSHHRLKHPDGRVTTVPVHGNEDLPKGLMRKIIREDLQVSVCLGLEEKQNVPTEIKLTLLNLKIVASYYSRFPKSICFRYGLSLESVKSSLDKLPFVISDRTIL